jgi:hypothetical protein
MIDKLTAADRPGVFRRPDGIIQFRPSEIGKCIRGLVACLLGFKPEPFDDKTNRIMKMGHILEPHIAYEFEQKYGGHVQRQISLNMPIEDFASVVGTCDGVWFPDASQVDPERFTVIDNGTRFDPETIVYHTPWDIEDTESHPVAYLIEIKAPGDSVFLKMSREGPSLGYKWQKSCYWHMAEHCLGIRLMGIVFIQGRRGDLLANYEFIDNPVFSKEQITERCKRVVEAANHGISDNPLSIDCDNISHFCNYWKIHKSKNPAEAETKNSKYEFDHSISQLALDYHLNGLELKEREIFEAGFKEELNRAMRGRDKVKTPGFSLYYGSKKFLDERRLAADRPDLVEKFSKFDAQAAVDSEEGLAEKLRERYSVSGEKFLTVRPVKKELEKIIAEELASKNVKTKKPKVVGAAKLDMEDMETFMNEFMS